MNILKKHISIIICAALIVCITNFHKPIKVYADPIFLPTAIIEIIAGIASSCGITYLNASNIKQHTNSYFNYIFDHYNVSLPSKEQMLWGTMLRMSGYSLEVTRNADQIVDSWHTLTSDGAYLYIAKSSVAASHFFNPLSLSPSDYYLLCQSIVDFFGTHILNRNSSDNYDITSTVDFSDIASNTALFSSFGWHFEDIIRFSDYPSSISDGDIAMIIFYNSGPAYYYFNRAYSTDANNCSYYFYRQGTFYQFSIRDYHQISVYNLNEWERHSVAGNTYSRLRIGCIGGDPLYPAVNMCGVECPLTFDDSLPYYIKGVYILGRYYDFSGLALPEAQVNYGLNDEITADDASLIDGILNGDQGYQVYLDNHFASATGYSSDQIHGAGSITLETPTYNEDQDVISYPTNTGIQLQGTSPTYNKDLTSVAAFDPEFKLDLANVLSYMFNPSISLPDIILDFKSCVPEPSISLNDFSLAASPIPDLVANIRGHQLTVISNKYLRENIESIRYILQMLVSFLYILHLIKGSYTIFRVSPGKAAHELSED